uniref:Putative ring-containing e3 ubiquitin ligase n=1 Tax=Rhodnius prolixus TaxID=13249 RepID=A0A4V0Y8N4_RHOPR
MEELENKDWEEFSPDELRRVELMRLKTLHKGHDAMHTEMVIIFFVTIIVAQIGLVEWKRRYPKSYQLVTLAAMWIIPMCLSIKNQWWRFIFLWLVFSCITAFIVKKAIEKPISGNTPGLVYMWFLLIYQLSFLLGIIGYVLFLLFLIRIDMFLGIKSQTMLESAVLFGFYGLYYGVLGQDIAEISSDKMASHIGYYSKDGIPARALENNICAVCGNEIFSIVSENGTVLNTYKLSCDHVFHEFCIRGWCIVGKKQICPYCKEKVDLKKMFRNPWEKPHVLYGTLLEWIRLLVAWQPIIIGIIQVINYVLGF